MAQGRTGFLSSWPDAVARRAVARVAGIASIVLATLVVMAGCTATGEPDERPADSAISVTDDAGRELRLPAPARRIVSLLPAGTETVTALGAVDLLVGRTRYDDAPEVSHLPSVGGGLDPSMEALAALAPDLVLLFETAGGSPLRAHLERMGVPVFGIATQDTSDVLRNIERIGTLIGRPDAADSLAAEIRRRLALVRERSRSGTPPRVLYVAGIDPPIIAGPSTFVMELVGVAGGAPVDAATRASGLWPQLSFEELVRQSPDVVMLPVGADPERAVARLRAAPGWRELDAVRAGRIVTVDADLSNRPGPAIAESAERMAEALRPYLARR
jgi:iron complex transport system substrate-binding protein